MSGNTHRDILLAGAFAAFTVDLLVYPLDTLKTRLQSPDYARLYTHAGTNAVNRAALFRGLYQGLGSVIGATLPSWGPFSPPPRPRFPGADPAAAGAFFTTYESCKSLLNATPLPLSAQHALSSGLAELVSCAILTPAEVVKQNAQMLAAGKGSRDALARFRKNPRALWRGYFALAGRNLPFTALQFPVFEWLRGRIRERRGREGGGRGRAGKGGNGKETIFEAAWITALSAGAAGSVAALVTTPVDVVKTRIMLAAAAEGGEHSSSTSTKAAGKGGGGQGIVDALGRAVKPQGRKSALAVAREVVAERGVVRGLFRGGLLRSVWTMVGAGLYLGTYEAGRLWLGGDDEGEKA